jgi:hypothetical protein
MTSVGYATVRFKLRQDRVAETTVAGRMVSPGDGFG